MIKVEKNNQQNKKNDKVFVILLHWRNYQDTKSCLLSLKRVNYQNLHIIVVDNFSNDGSLEKLKSEFSNITYSENKLNLGFSGGVNTGIRIAYQRDANYVLILNNDMIVEPGFLQPAVKIADSYKSVGAITGKILYQKSKNIIWHAGGYVDPFRVQGVGRGTGEEDLGQYDEICETGWASGAMSLIPRKTIESVGYYPEEHFFGQEEWDYSTAILRAGLKIVYVPEFKGVHRSGGSYKGGHPILNIYGGYLSKMIYAEKYQSRIRFLIWKLSFFIYLQTKWKKLAREGCECEEDFIVKYNAGFLAYKDHKKIKRVVLPVLEDAAKRLGSSPTWGTDWASESD